MRWVSVGKYSSTGRPLAVILPVPGRSRTRATDSLRRPVVCTSGAGMWSGSFDSAGAASTLDDEGLRVLGGVGMGGTGVHLELLQHLAAEPVLREHAPDRAAHGVLGVAAERLAVGLRLDATGEAGVTPQELALGLVRGEHDLVGVHDDDVVAGVDVRRERGLVLAAQDAGDLGGHAAEHEVLGVDDVPGALDVGWAGG